MLVGIGIGIGFGALIFHPFNSNGLGGGIWFGKKRRKRQIKDRKRINHDTNNEPMNEEKISILQWINQAEKTYNDK